jgi:formate hydrogenlyase subunit 6/NADH:ubiquinone oxidoreductase subunit I
VVESLAEQVNREVLACIGCHDCMLACPLPEASLVTIAELNDAVGRARIGDERVARFLAACTQCRQCVPVCPADLSRADMVLFNKLKLEDALPDRQLLIQVGASVHAASLTRDARARRHPPLRRRRPRRSAPPRAPGHAAEPRAG